LKGTRGVWGVCLIKKLRIRHRNVFNVYINVALTPHNKQQMIECKKE